MELPASAAGIKKKAVYSLYSKKNLTSYYNVTHTTTMNLDIEYVYIVVPHPSTRFFL